MNTLAEKVLPMYEKVIHIAFGCGCVQSFHAKQLTLVKCPIHGDHILSTTEEWVPKAQAA
jgi:hypothetical protein